jgi:hypothetical protein
MLLLLDNGFLAYADESHIDKCLSADEYDAFVNFTICVLKLMNIINVLMLAVRHGLIRSLRHEHYTSTIRTHRRGFYQSSFALARLKRAPIRANTSSLATFFWMLALMHWVMNLQNATQAQSIALLPSLHKHCYAPILWSKTHEPEPSQN